MDLLNLLKSGPARHIGILDSCIEPIMFSFFPVPDYFHKGFHIGVFFKVAEELQQKKAYWIIGKAQDRVFVSHNGADKREVNKRGDKPGEAADDSTIGIDFNMTLNR